MENSIGVFDLAIVDLDRAIERDPEKTAAYIDRGIACYNNGDLDWANADYTRGNRFIFSR